MDSQHARGANRRWPFYWSAIGLLLLAASGCSPMAQRGASSGSTHLFVWAWDVDHKALTAGWLLVRGVDDVKWRQRAAQASTGGSLAMATVSFEDAI